MRLKKIAIFALSILAMGLPWQGAISVFLPEIFRFWKEFVLLSLLLIGLYPFFTNLQKNIKVLKNFSKNPLYRSSFLFLLWGLFLILLSADPGYALIAFRYLGTGFFVFLLLSWIFEQEPLLAHKQIVMRGIKIFIASNIISVFFGIWMKFLGGIEILQNFYSPTISSWVPGQKTPLYHLTGDFIRMQGGASGPIEFSHLCFLALFLLVFGQTQKIKYSVQKGFKPQDLKPLFLNFLGLVLLLFGIGQSGSRASMLVSGILILFFCFEIYSSQNSKKKSLSKKPQNNFFTPGKMVRNAKILLGLILCVAGLKFLIVKTPILNFIETKVLSRSGDSDHLTRPIEGLKRWVKNPIKGHLGNSGPAARIKNMTENNSDQAFISENVFIDTLIQTGIIGFLFFMIFFIFLIRDFWRKRPKIFGPILLLGLFFIPMNLATIFDMTPISIGFFALLAWLYALSSDPPPTPK